MLKPITPDPSSSNLVKLSISQMTSVAGYAFFALMLPVLTGSKGVSLLAVGDWGGGSDQDPTTRAQISDAVGMSKVANQTGAQGVLLLGDNFYSSGVSDATSSRFQETFEDVYTVKEFGTLPFHVIAGNHDHRGNVSAQCRYKDAAERWRFPSLWYALSFPFTSSSRKQRTVQLIMIDTVNLAGNSDDVCKGCELNGSANASLAEDQWSWIEDQLKSSTADFVWVAGHYPIYSAGDDGTTGVLVQRLLPMLKQYGAHYVNGHDHMLEHISYDGVEMYVAGMGKECCYGVGHLATVPVGAIKFLIEGNGGQGSQNVGPKPSAPVQSGFVSFSWDDVATIKYHNQDGDVLYRAPDVPPRLKMVV